MVAEATGMPAVQQEVQKGVSAAFDRAQAPPSHHPSDPQPPTASTAAGQSQAPPAAGQAAASPGQVTSAARQPAAGPRTLWSEAAELAEARERAQWHELMSRRNMEPNEKLQVDLCETNFSLCCRVVQQ